MISYNAELLIRNDMVQPRKSPTKHALPKILTTKGHGGWHCLHQNSAVTGGAAVLAHALNAYGSELPKNRNTTTFMENSRAL
jgi:hypothetical protein